MPFQFFLNILLFSRTPRSMPHIRTTTHFYGDFLMFEI